SALAVFLTLLLVLIFTSAWSARLAWGVAAVLVSGLGSFCQPVSDHLRRLAAILTTIDLEWDWLWLLLGLIPLTLVSWHSLSFCKRSRDPGVMRRRLAFAARALALACVTFALAEPQLNVPHDHTTVLFVLDRSLSVPEELMADGSDRRWLRIRKFMN